MRPSSRSVLIVLVAGIALVAMACSSGTAKGIVISDAWARAQPDAAAPSAAYLTVTNMTGQADALLSATSPGAMVGMHETAMDSTGMTGMQQVQQIVVPANGEVALKPGGYHLMLMNLTKPLAVGDKLEIDLVFANAGQVKVEAEVKDG